MRHRSRPWGWPLVVLITVCLAVLAWDVSRLPGFPDWTWTALYATAAIGFVMWRIMFAAPLLLVSMGALFVASFARAAAFAIWQPHRQAGIALNILIAVFAALTMRSQLRWSK